ncbi:MAG: FG-GAP repeat protein [Alphaproteobacteria bacterium]|nr:FG-GAP repeat protein [Alphaproteobacteria bacterium]
MHRLLLLAALALSACKDDDVADDSAVDLDRDGDGYAEPEDCDDDDPTVHPEAEERCDGVDQDCDGEADEDLTRPFYPDLDRDGFGVDSPVTLACAAPPLFAEVSGDCDDADPAVNPDATEVCNGLDDDCDGTVDGPDAADALTWHPDMDGDGYGDPTQSVVSCAAPGGWVTDDRDCDDADPTLNPDTLWYRDADGDGHGLASDAAASCLQPSGFVATAEDCDDADPAVNPDATEVCNGLDDDCDGATDGPDAIDPSTWYADADGDGYGDPDAATLACDAPAGHIADASDCDDADPAVNPGAAEVCNGLDDDCDGATDGPDAIDPSTWYADDDGDGYGDPDDSALACDAPAGAVADATDCDDDDAAVNPGATEVCNGLDDDCDGATDGPNAADAGTWYADDDGDGYGDPDDATLACDAPTGAVADDQDCDDDDATQNPDTLWYTDADGDGFGDPAAVTQTCERPANARRNSRDCDDTDASVSPNGVEVCNGVDDDCDGAVDGVDAEDSATWYTDDDGDGFGDPSASTAACTQPSGAVSDDTDCDDTDPAVNPDATEVCNSLDDDCDGLVDADDPDVSPSSGSWYADTDGDGYGDPDDPSACGGSGYVADDTDCDDNVAVMNPGEPEVCDGLDNDCDGTIDGLSGCNTTALADADAILYTSSAWVELGTSVAGLGDVDGDGYGDLLVGTMGTYRFLLGPVTGAVDTDTDYDAYLYQSGSGRSRSITGPGDLDGDGLPDMAFGEHDVVLWDESTPGIVYVVTRVPSGRTRTVDAQFRGENTGDYVGYSVAGAGDVDGNGVDDLLIGAPEYLANQGAAYLVLGPVTGMTLSDADGFIEGDNNSDYLGQHVTTAGDVDGDGLSEILVFAPSNDDAGSGAGAGYLFHGPVTGSFMASDADTTFWGATGDRLTHGSAGDINGDGYSDVLIGIPSYDSPTADIGGVAVFYGPSLGASVDANAAADVVSGEAGRWGAGDLVISGEDADGDGYDDILTRAWYAAPDGGYYIAYQYAGPVSGAASLADATARYIGIPYVGSENPDSMDWAGDVDGDGYMDVIIGAPNYSDVAEVAGAGFLFLGAP